jgi:TatD DNase family protein
MQRAGANSMRLVDTHTHLEQVEDVAGALQRARAVGVVAVVAVGMDLASNKQALDLAAGNPGLVYPALGIHPWTISPTEKDDTIAFIRSNIEGCVAVGEIGLDYWIKQDKELQREVFAELLAIADQHGKPVSTHSRGSYEDVFRMVVESGVANSVFHWYSGPLDIVDEIVRRGFFVSATPAAAYSEKHRAVIEKIPLDNLLIETDCPVQYGDRISEPADVKVTLEEVARLKGEPADIVARATTQNASRLFGLNVNG